MTTAPQTFYCNDAAGDIAELIEEYETKAESAQRTRDKHRAETSILALKEALRLVLLERECAAHGRAVPMPDIEEYLRSHRRPPTV